MADITDERKEAQEILAEIKSDYWEDDGYGYPTEWCQRTLYALDFAISDMERVEELEAENKRLKDGIEETKAEIERKKQEINLKRLDDYEKAQAEMRLSTLNELLQVIKKYLGE